MDLKIVTIYPDEGRPGEHVKELFADGHLLLRGDEYHDKITQAIGGFLYALDFLAVEYALEYEIVCDEPSYV